MNNLIRLKKNISKIDCVNSLINVDIDHNKIQKVTFENINFGILSLTLLSKNNLDDLYDFYYSGLNENSRNLWPPYPLFKPKLNSRDELHKRYNEWLKEKDWFVWLLSNDEVIGASVLKKLSWKDDEKSTYRTPASGLAVAEKYKRNGFGFFLQKIIEFQAYLYGSKKIFVTIEEKNIPSIRVHKKAGFIETGRKIQRFKDIDGEKIFDSIYIELILKLKNDY